MRTTPNQRVAANIRAELGRRSLTHEALTSAAGMSLPAFRRRLYGYVPFSVNEVDTIAAALGVDTSTLLTGVTEGATA